MPEPDQALRVEIPERRIYTVSELTEEIKRGLEREYPSVWIQGEISNLHAAPSGHIYFTLKDQGAQIRCVMFKLQSRFLKFKPDQGLQIIAWGRLSLYVPRGEYQLILDTMEPKGLGSLMLAFEQLKAKLAAEGLFDHDRKRALPPFPKAIGLVTSRKGAAVRDMIRIAGRRFPGTDIVVGSTSVQGDKAPDEIVAALTGLQAEGSVDVIIIGRGGGSIEDLWAFNDERVVRAVAACTIPIVSAVGHETDFTLTDFASDLRASTPSAAAELVIPDRREIEARVGHLAGRLRSSMMRRLERAEAQLRETLRRLYDPRRKIEERRQRLDDLSVRLAAAMSRKLDKIRTDREALVRRLRPEHLRRTLYAARTEAETLSNRLTRTGGDMIREHRSALERLAGELDALSPLAVLSRGYSITTRADTGEVVTDAVSVQPDEAVNIRLRRGRLACRIEETLDIPD
ncbi:MAG: exodeoxyribonuclease VII large subunit [Pseudomonadota bacterium]